MWKTLCIVFTLAIVVKCQSGTSCSSPIAMISDPSTPLTYPGSNSYSNFQTNCFGSGYFVWYSLSVANVISSPNATITLTTCSEETDFDTTISVFGVVVGCPGVCYAFNDDSNCALNNNGTSTVTINNVVSFPVNPGNVPTILVAVGGANNATGNFEIIVSVEDVVGSGCPAATPVYGSYANPITLFGSFRYSSSPIIKSCGQMDAASTTWYHVFPVPNVPFEISTCHYYTTTDTTLVVFAGQDCSSLTCLPTTNNACGGTFGSSVSFIPTSNSYFIVVTSTATNGKTYEMSLHQEIDSTVACENAQVIKRGDMITANFADAVVMSRDPCNVMTGDYAVWFKLDLTSLNPVQISNICNSGTTIVDSSIVVFSGTCSFYECTAIDALQTYCSAVESVLATLSFTPIHYNYYVAITGTTLGTFTLQIS